MSRQWPSGWEDPEDEELDAEELDAGTEARLSEVAAFLATVPAPVLPGAIESRIVAALAAESAARAEDSPAPAPEPAGPRILRPAPAQTRAQARARARMHRRRRFSSAMVAGPLVAVLLFAGLGYVISRGASSSSSSSVTSAAPASSAAAGSEGSASGYSADRSAAGAPQTPVFAPSASGTKYLAATLVAQVRAKLAVQNVTPAAASAVPGPLDTSAPVTSAPAASASSSSAAASSTSGSAGSAKASSILHGCVLHFTKTPRLIDRATYQGTPAYVIADSTHVWVVGLGCTAQHQHLIASASLAG